MMKHHNNSKLSKVDLWFQKAFSAHNAGKLEEAESLYRRILEKTPSDMETLYLLGTACCQLEKYDDAIKYLKRSVDIAPNHPEALNNMGLALKKLHKEEEALPYYRRALAQKPEYADACSNLGAALEELGQLDEAETHLRHALRLNPGLADAYYGLGLVLRKKDCFEEASQCFLHVLKLKPDSAEAYSDLGTIYKIWGRHDEALACFERALSLKPNYYIAQHNLGTVFEEMGRLDEAGEAYDRAMVLNPDNLTTNWNKAFFYLQQGILDKGWEAHEFRFRPQLGITLNRFPFPEWDGSSLEDKTILIYAEQGLGDEIMFASCIPDVLAKAKHCVIECEPRLAMLFSRSFPAATVVGAMRDQIGWLLKMPKIDVQCAGGSLPRFLRPTLESFPQTPAYLTADPQRVEYWRSRLALLGPGIKVGICWRSSLRKGERHRFYSQLTQWGEVFKVPGVHFVNLQYDDCVEELREAEEKFGVAITSFSDIDLRNEIDESAALTAGMDLVISAATAVAEIAGALGVNAYRLNHYGKQWEVLGCTDKMPWHPNVSLFDQTTQDDWDTQLALVATALNDMVLGNSREIEYAQLSSGGEIAINGSLNDLSTYVLREQRGWFDQEYQFILNLIQPDMRIVDVGAGVGIYTIPLAKRISSGRLWAITHTAAETNLLMKSRMRNRLEKSVNIAIADQSRSLDLEIDKHGLNDIAFVRIARDACNLDLLSGGTRFFSINSPLVMFGIGSGTDFDLEVVEWLIAHGYGLYRLIPGLGTLVPYVSVGELDAYALNLFACKPDRAAYLERQGILIRRLHTLDQLPGIDNRHWQEYLRTMPYAADRVDGWVNAQQRQQGWEVYWMALNLFAMAKNENRQRAEQYACLQMANSVMSALVQEQATLPRLLSLCTVLTELGKREVAVGLLNQICVLLNSGVTCSLDEPCLALTETFTLTRPDAKGNAWIVAMVLAQRERLRAFSSFFSGPDALPVLQEIQGLGFGSEEIDRQIMLIKTRFAAD